MLRDGNLWKIKVQNHKEEYKHEVRTIAMVEIQKVEQLIIF